MHIAVQYFVRFGDTYISFAKRHKTRKIDLKKIKRFFPVDSASNLYEKKKKMTRVEHIVFTAV